MLQNFAEHIYGGIGIRPKGYRFLRPISRFQSSYCYRIHDWRACVRAYNRGQAIISQTLHQIKYPSYCAEQSSEPHQEYEKLYFIWHRCRKYGFTKSIIAIKDFRVIPSPTIWKCLHFRKKYNQIHAQKIWEK